MNKFIIVALIFALTSCKLAYDGCVKRDHTTYNAHQLEIDTTHKNYEYNIEFDWTDDDNKEIRVPFIEGVNEDEIIPLFFNASELTFVKSLSCRWKEDSSKPDNLECNGKNYSSLDEIKLYDKYKVFQTFDYKLEGNSIKQDIVAKNFGANSNDITRKYIKYFGFAYCSGNDIEIITTNILVTINNGNYFSVSKILLISLALIFL
jgi:hypothetical protein